MVNGKEENYTVVLDASLLPERSDYYLINVQQLRSVEEDPLNVHGTVTPTIVDLEADVDGT